MTPTNLKSANLVAVLNTYLGLNPIKPRPNLESKLYYISLLNLFYSSGEGHNVDIGTPPPGLDRMVLGQLTEADQPPPPAISHGKCAEHIHLLHI